jgi:hypothetical protein
VTPVPGWWCPICQTIEIPHWTTVGPLRVGPWHPFGEGAHPSMHGLVPAAEVHGLLPVEVEMAWWPAGTTTGMEIVIRERGQYRTVEAGEPV